MHKEKRKEAMLSQMQNNKHIQGKGLLPIGYFWNANNSQVSIQLNTENSVFISETVPDATATAGVRSDDKGIR